MQAAGFLCARAVRILDFRLGLHQVALRLSQRRDAGRAKEHNGSFDAFFLKTLLRFDQFAEYANFPSCLAVEKISVIIRFYRQFFMVCGFWGFHVV